MYRIYADGECLYDPSLAADKRYAAYSPHVNKELNLAGSASFVLPPENCMYDHIEMLKTVITVQQDGEEIFRGRVMDVTVDSFLQKTVYAEGELAYLIDSIKRPYEYKGNVQELFRQYLENHNAQVDPEKQFAPGIITAVSDTESTHVKNTGYAETFSEIQARLTDVYGGYLRTREEGGKRVIDWLASFGPDNTQPIEIGVNLIDLQAGGNSSDIFTVLIPLGAAVEGEGGETQPLTISSVNGGLDFIEDAEAITRYGRIVRTYTWSHVEDAAELLEKARAYLAYGITANATLQIKAIDMHLLDSTVQRIDLGSNVQIKSDPHGITRFEICSAIDIDLENPENTTYTFGEPKKTLSENVVRVNEKMGGGGGGGGTGLEEETLWLQRWAELYVTNNEANILMLTGQIDSYAQRMSRAEVEIDGIEARITLTASELIELEERTTSSEAQIAINKDSIASKVEKDGVISAVNQSPESYKIAARLIELEGYVTASEFNATLAEITFQYALKVETDMLLASRCEFGEVDIDTLTFSGSRMTLSTIRMGSHISESVLSPKVGGIDLAHSHAVSVSEDGTVTLGEVSETGGNFKIADTKTYKDGVSAAYNRGYSAAYDEAYAAGYESGWVAAAAMATTTRSGGTITVKAPSSIVDTPADDMRFVVGTGGEITSIRHTSGNTFRAVGTARAYITINGGSPIAVASTNLLKTETIVIQ